MAACPVCGGGGSRRQCPALETMICATCCGTKRQVEIRCPDTCRWLQSARAHPHAALQRRQEQDAALVVPLVRELDDAAYAVLMTTLQAAMVHGAEADPPPLDADLEEAAAALAATAETAIRGVLYEHQPVSPVAARLARAMSAPLADAAEAGMPGLDRATVTAMRRLEHMVKGVRGSSPAGPDACFELLQRVLEPRLADAGTGQPIAGASAPRVVLS